MDGRTDRGVREGGSRESARTPWRRTVNLLERRKKGGKDKKQSKRKSVKTKKVKKKRKDRKKKENKKSSD